MVTKRFMMRAFAGLSLWAGFGSAAQAQLPQVTVDDALKVQPRQKGVNVSTPPAGDAARCTVAPIPDPKNQKPMGYVVRDPAGKPVRQFVSYDGKSFNIIAFYVDGAEAYREVYPPETGQAYQFRWLGSNGTKWGLDKDRDGRIDEWMVISPEELSQELLQAVLTRDPKRVEALTLNKANLDYLGLQGAEAQRLLERAAGAAGRIAKAADELKAAPNSEWVHLQLSIPQAIPADATGSREDLVIHRIGTVILKDGANSKSLQTGELVQVGRAWKLIDGPTVGVSAGGGGTDPFFDGIKEFVAELDKIDEVGAGNPPTTATIAAYNAKRVAVLEKINTKLTAEIPEKVREVWIKQLIESLSAASEGEKLDGRHVMRLKQFKDAFAGKPGAIGSYAWFRYLLTENNILLRDVKPGELQTLQEKWRTNLEEFIKANQNSDDAPEATLRLGMAYEFLLTKEGDAKAKEWYERLAKNYVGHPHAIKAAGAVKRLTSEGTTLEVSGPNLANGQAFSVSSLAGKVVVVYYCANWSSTLAEDARKLRSLVKEYGPKGLELVVVSLDHDAKTAAETIATHQLPGTVLHAPGGLDNSPLAAQYGVLVAPQIFIANKEGKIVSRNTQAVNLDDDVRKLLP